MLEVLLLLIFFACVGCLFTEGMWGNAVRLINVVTSALLATNLFEPVADWLEGRFPTYTFVWDFLALWALFAIFMVVFRGATDFLSRVKVRFLSLADRIGSGVFAVCIGCVMVCFTTMSLHTAPMAREFMFGSFTPKKRALMGIAPDRKWLGFMHRMSRGTFSRSATKKELSRQTYGARDDDPAWAKKICVFDRNGEFTSKYASRRDNIDIHMKKPNTKSLRVRIK